MNLKKNKFGTRSLIIISLIIAFLFFAVSNATASISPAEVIKELDAGECYTVEKTIVEIPGEPKKVDVVFSFDLTSSMGEILNMAKSKSGEIMNELITNFPMVSFNFGVISYMDYPKYFSSCDYSDLYGEPDLDYAYSLNQSLTDVTTDVTTAIDGLSLGGGWDLPESYARIFYESYNDSNIGWRNDAEKLLVNFADSYPHDCNLNESIYSGTWSTGSDPGPDEEVNTIDDLDFQTVLAEMNSNGRTLIECHSSTSYLDYWENWTGITGGSVQYTSSSTFVDDVIDAITGGLTIPKIYNLTLNVTTSGFESWLSPVDPYPEVFMGTSVTFEVTICVPVETSPGVYEFNVSAVDGDEINYGNQTNIVTVIVNEPPDEPIDPDPDDGDTGVSTSPTLSVYVSDPEGEVLSVSFYDDGDNPIGVDTDVLSGSTASVVWSGLSYSTVYSWYAIANDSQLETKSDTWSFTTKNEPQPPPPPPPPPPDNNIPPIADASAGEPYIGFIGEDITFDGSDSYDPDTGGYIISWHWNFDDGTDGYGEKITHNYSSVGTYHVTLTVTDDKSETDTETFDVVISIANNAPEDLEVDGPLTGDQNTDYDYTASATDPDEDDMLRFIFEWGDGTTTTSDVVASGVIATVTHNWSKYGVFEVTVRAVDNYSSEISTTFTVLIDVIVVEGDITGLIIDEDGSDPFDIFNNTDTDGETEVELDNGSYLIDSDGDGKWDYAYDPDTGLITYYDFVYEKYFVIYEANKAPGFELLTMLAVIGLIAIILRKKRKNN